jgi:SPOR domain
MKLLLLPLVCALALLAGCTNPEDQAFKRARMTDTVVGWEDFLRQFPDGEQTDAARRRLVELHEDREWQRAELGDSVASYQEYLRGYPQGRFASEALVRIANLNLRDVPDGEPTPQELRAAQAAREASAGDRAPAVLPPVAASGVEGAAPKGPTALINRAPPRQPAATPMPASKPVVAPKPTLKPAPKPVAPPVVAPKPKQAPPVATPKPALKSTPKPAPKSAPKPVAAATPAPAPAPTPVAPPAAALASASVGGDWSVQLGAFGKGEAAALQHWARLQRAVPAAVAGLQPEVAGPLEGKPFHRLRVVGLSRERARDLCVAVRAAGEGCVVTAP